MKKRKERQKWRSFFVPKGHGGSLRLISLE